MEEHQKELSKILGLSRGLTGSGNASWAEIYVEIGKLKERAERLPIKEYIPSYGTMPLSSPVGTSVCVCGKSYPHTCVTCN